MYKKFKIPKNTINIETEIYIRGNMRKKALAIFFLLILSFQVFPIKGFQSLYNELVGASQEDSAFLQMTPEEEQVEEIGVKFANAENYHAHYFEMDVFLCFSGMSQQAILSIGETLDRNDPILIPPPNELM